MPHVRVRGDCSARGYWERFEPGQRRDEERISKTLACFLAKDGASALVECMTVEGFLRQTFLAQILQKDDGVLVRLYHAWAPEKTPGVRACLGWIAASFRGIDPACRIEAENLGIPLPPR